MTRDGIAAQGLTVREVRNPVLTYPGVPFLVEKATNRDLLRLREKYRLDRIVKFRGTEFQKMLAVRHWIRSKIDTTSTPAKCPFDALSILAEAERGGKFYCSHFALVSTQVFTALGWIARDVAIDHLRLNGERGRHHGIFEVWCNELMKWIALDAMFDSHVERQGIPLSVIEIRESWLRCGGTDLRIVVGPQRREVALTREGTATNRHESSAYFWYCYTTHSNFFEKPMDWRSENHRYLLYLDEANLGKVWGHPDKVHGYYTSGLFLGSTRREDFDWNVNRVHMTPGAVLRGRVSVRLETNTPNPGHLELRLGKGAWKRCGKRITAPLGPKGAELSARSVNAFGLAGPVSTIQVRRK